MLIQRRDLIRGALALGATTALWTSQVHRLLQPAEAATPTGEPLTARTHAALNTLLRRARTGEHRAALRRTNPEWDLLERMIGGLALACGALTEPSLRPEVAPVLRESALRAHALAEERGHAWFLLPYVRRGTFRGPQRSLFVDGEVAVHLGTALLLQPGDRRLRTALAERVAQVVRSLQAGPIGSGESYPDECWTYCNTTALVALRMAEVLLGHDHGERARAWLAGARTHLVHEGTGLLQSACTWEGRATQPPEGSSLWWSAHALRLIDAGLARDQFERTREALVGWQLGFAYAREWPDGAEARMDVDSGGIVPGLGASPASSGLALVAARSFGDGRLMRGLWSSVELAGFPETREGGWRLRAGNALGDAVAAYGLVQGPVWARLGAVR